MSTSSHDGAGGAPMTHLDRLLALVDEVDFIEQLGRAEELIDRRRDELVRERRAAVRARRATKVPTDSSTRQNMHEGSNGR